MVRRVREVVLSMDIRDGYDVRQAPGWWPSLVVVTCKRCGEESGTIDLNDGRSTNSFTGRPRWMYSHECR